MSKAVKRKPKIATTFLACREAGACQESYRAMARALGGIKKHGADTPTPVLKVLDVLGFEDALWVLGYTGGVEGKKLLRLFAADCAARVLCVYEARWPRDMRVREAIKAARARAYGRIGDSEKGAHHFKLRRLLMSRPLCESRNILPRYAVRSALRAFYGSACGSSRYGELAVDAFGDSTRERKWQEKQLRAYLNGTAKPVRLPPKPTS